MRASSPLTDERSIDGLLTYGLTDVGGLLWYPGDSDEASLNPALNAAMLLTRYAQIATTQDKKTNYIVRPPSSSIT